MIPLPRRRLHRAHRAVSGRARRRDGRPPVALLAPDRRRERASRPGSRAVLRSGSRCRISSAPPITPWPGCGSADGRRCSRRCIKLALTLGGGLALLDSAGEPQRVAGALAGHAAGAGGAVAAEPARACRSRSGAPFASRRGSDSTESRRRCSPWISRSGCCSGLRSARRWCSRRLPHGEGRRVGGGPGRGWSGWGCRSRSPGRRRVSSRRCSTSSRR